MVCMLLPMNELKPVSLKSLSNERLLQNTQALVAEERKLTTSILWHMHEIQKRRLYAEKGYGSLFEYAVKELSYSEAAAGRRIAAMRLLVEVPEIEPALERGDVSLSTLSTIQSFIQRKEEPVSKDEKRELVFALQGKSRRECEKELSALDPQAALPQERERVVSPTQTEIRFIADDSLMEKLQSIRELDGHVQSNPSYLELFHRMADLTLKKLDPLSSKKTTHKKTVRDEVTKNAQTADKKSPQSRAADSTPPAECSPAPAQTQSQPAQHESIQSTGQSTGQSTSRYIPAALKREIWRRDQGQCSYCSPDGRRCNSRFALEVDHVEPFALGGKTEASNLRLLCRAHNTHQAIAKLGPNRMQAYVR